MNCLIKDWRIVTIFTAVVIIICFSGAYGVPMDVAYSQAYMYKEESTPSGSFIKDQNGTDIGLYNENLFEGDILLEELNFKNAVADNNKLWPNGIVVFKIADDVGCPDSRQCKIIMQAMEDYHRKTCLRFKEWTGENDFVEIFYNSGDSGACWSSVGRTGGKQKLSLGYRCWYLGIAIHELGHAVGFWHEMNRPDRDSHILIIWKNILPGFASIFNKNSPSTVNNLGEHLDLKSVMMYDEYAFSKDGKSPTIETKSGETIGPVWKKQGLSLSDIMRVHKLYKCDGNTVKTEFPHGFKCDFSSHTCGFRNREKTVWKWKSFYKSGYISARGNPSSSGSQLISVNFHPVEEVSTHNVEGCLSFSYFLTGNSSMKVNQEVLQSVTDVSRGFTRKLWNSQYSTGRWRKSQIALHLQKPYRIVFEPVFNTYGIVALTNTQISTEPCSSLSNDL